MRNSKILLDPSEISIQRNFRKPHQDHIKKLDQEIFRNYLEYPALDPVRYFIDPGKNLVFQMTEVGRDICLWNEIRTSAIDF